MQTYSSRPNSWTASPRSPAPLRHTRGRFWLSAHRRKPRTNGSGRYWPAKHFPLLHCLKQIYQAFNTFSWENEMVYLSVSTKKLFGLGASDACEIALQITPCHSLIFRTLLYSHKSSHFELSLWSVVAMLLFNLAVLYWVSVFLSSFQYICLFHDFQSFQTLQASFL